MVENNLIECNQLDAGGDYWDGAICVDGGHHITLRGNVISNNHGPGIQISDEDVQYPDWSTDYLLEGNTVSGNLFGIYMWDFSVCPFPKSEIVHMMDNRIENNIFRDDWCLEWPCGERKGCD